MTVVPSARRAGKEAGSVAEVFTTSTSPGSSISGSPVKRAWRNRSGDATSRRTPSRASPRLRRPAGLGGLREHGGERAHASIPASSRAR